MLQGKKYVPYLDMNLSMRAFIKRESLQKHRRNHANGTSPMTLSTIPAVLSFVLDHQFQSKDLP